MTQRILLLYCYNIILVYVPHIHMDVSEVKETDLLNDPLMHYEPTQDY